MLLQLPITHIRYFTYDLKDLSKIGRDICKVIIIDNCAENFKQQPHNGLEIVTWENDMNDNQLLDLMRILKGK
jgi:TFIIF-interacting CTD phosphatase-like protein